jgi:MFS family permease
VVGDRVGRKRALTYTILLYSAFTSLSAFSLEWWHLAGFRFLVALGVGGEWAVASALVAEEFPRRARAWSQSIFHASSVLGTYLAIAAGFFLVARAEVVFHVPLSGWWEMPGWRLAFLLGAVPALLIVWIRVSLHEPEAWLRTRGRDPQGVQSGRLRDLFAGGLARGTLVGVGLATVGLATFWGTHIYGKDRYRQAAEERYLAALPPGAPDEERKQVLQDNAPAIKRAEMWGMLLATTGGGLGLLAFGPLSERLGRRGAFLLFQLGGLASALVLFRVLRGEAALALFLPVFGFWTLGMHAGFAVYFPELFPTRLRGTGAGFCFNAARLLTAPILLLSGWVGKGGRYTVEDAASLLSLLFVPGAVLLLLAPETRGQELPE